MKTVKEPKAITEVCRIRRDLQQEARRVGRKKYHQMLNRSRGWFLVAETAVVRETPKKTYGGRKGK